MWLLNVVALLSVFYSVLIYDDLKVKTKDGFYLLTMNNFDFVVKNHKFVLVLFCPHFSACVKTAPEYIKALTEMQIQGWKVRNAIVETSQNYNLASEFNIQQYPTLLFFREGIPDTYTGSGKAEDIFMWLQKQYGLATLDSLEFAHKVITRNKMFIVGFFDDRDSENAERFRGVAAKIEPIPFAITTNKEVLKKYEVESSTIVLFKTFDHDKAIFRGEITEGNVKAFLKTEIVPTIMHFNYMSEKIIFTGEMKTSLFLFFSSNANNVETYLRQFRNVAKEFKGKLLFVAVNVNEPKYHYLLHLFGTKKEHVPLMRLIDIKDTNRIDKYQPRDNDVSPKAVLHFGKSFLAGNLTNYVVNQALPKDWDQGRVTTLVTENFDVAFTKDKNVLVLFYIPNSKKCRDFAPIYEELGQIYKHSTSVMIAKIDLLANDMTYIRIKSFPAIKLFKKGDNAIVEYQGVLKLDALVRFIESGGKIQQRNLS